MKYSIKRLFINFFTLLRLIVSPILFYTIMLEKNSVSLVLIVFGAFTDIMDGYAAKRLHASSKRGMVFDSIADITFYVALGLALIFFRDVPFDIIILAIVIGLIIAWLAIYHSLKGLPWKFLHKSQFQKISFLSYPMVIAFLFSIKYKEILAYITLSLLLLYFISNLVDIIKKKKDDQ